jgi:hypothetical protein
MGCSKCKKKEKTVFNEIEGMSSYVVWGMIIWSLFALYGIYSLISNLI